jgi:GNAT superfamily N-acetyltransferase
MVSVRAATLQDASAISHVHVQSWLTTYAGIVPDDYLSSLNEAERVPLWREWLVRDIHVYVAELDGQVVGFVSGGQIREPLQEYDAELFAIYLLKRAQGIGIGTALLRKLAGSLNDRASRAWPFGCSKTTLPFTSTRNRAPCTCRPKRFKSETLCFLNSPLDGLDWQ